MFDLSVVPKLKEIQTRLSKRSVKTLAASPDGLEEVKLFLYAQHVREREREMEGKRKRERERGEREREGEKRERERERERWIKESGKGSGS